MTANFYQNTSLLYEEFQKRELEHIRLGRMTTKSIFHNDKEPLKKYLAKISERERQMERNSRSLMNQMEDLDRRIEMMTLKVEKLAVLQNNLRFRNTSIFSSTDSLQNLPESYKFSQPIFYSTPKFQTEKLASNFESASSQTENIITCNHCNNQISLNLESSNNSIPCPPINMATLKLMQENSMEMFSSNRTPSPLDYVLSSERKQNLSVRQNDSNIVSGLNQSAIVDINQPTRNEGILKSQEYSKCVSHLNNSVTVMDTNEAAIIGDRRISLTQGQNVGSNLTNAAVITSSSQPAAPKADIKQSYSLHNNTNVDNSYGSEAKTQTVVSTQQISDANNSISPETTTSMKDHSSFRKLKSTGSIDNEFDFLETDNKDETYRVDNTDNNQNKLNNFHQQNENTEVSTNDVGHSDAQTSVMLKMASETDSLDDSRLQNMETGLKQDSHMKNTDKKNKIAFADNDLLDNKGNRSPSVHSENLSVTDVEDSLSEPNVPLTASAAYQALLGNVPIQKVSENRVLSDSESEDDIENAIAYAVRKSSNESDLGEVSEKQKPELGKAEEKQTKKPKLSTAQKPKTKLTKQTRKILGLDTSSGSEVEIETKVVDTTKESDEFDFFD